MKYYIGIDGGGTKTRCVLTDDLLKVLQTEESRAANPLAVSFEKAAECLLNLIMSVIEKEQLNFGMIESIGIGLAGVGRIENREKLQKIILEKFSFAKDKVQKIEIFTDAEIALEGAFNGEAGAILIAGTGSIIYGKDESGKIFRVGGFGKTIGDEGSGYTIGRKGLAAIAKYFDGRGKETWLVKKISGQFGIQDSNQLINKMHLENFDIAAIAKLVIDCADEGDEICINILDQESDELLSHISALMKEMNVNKLDLCLSGSLLTNTNYYSKRLKDKIRRSFHQINIKQATYPPETGAILLAKKSDS
ncbi:MAG: ROK family protein [Ignavibacteriales bacterium]|nr:ROK family protein [Ignavibacteriales bacterium]